jgi:hypothetical protein
LGPAGCFKQADEIPFLFVFFIGIAQAGGVVGTPA